MGEEIKGTYRLGGGGCRLNPGQHWITRICFTAFAIVDMLLTNVSNFNHIRLRVLMTRVFLRPGQTSVGYRYRDGALSASRGRSVADRSRGEVDIWFASPESGDFNR